MPQTCATAAVTAVGGKSGDSTRASSRSWTTRMASKDGGTGFVGAPPGATTAAKRWSGLGDLYYALPHTHALRTSRVDCVSITRYEERHRRQAWPRPMTSALIASMKKLHTLSVECT